jgi:hypothetical protein
MTATLRTDPATARVRGNVPNPMFWNVAKSEPVPENIRATLKITNVTITHTMNGRAIISIIIEREYPNVKPNPE